MGRLDGKACVITGAGRGIGREAAIVFSGEGARVCVADIVPETAEETVPQKPTPSSSLDSVDARYGAPGGLE